MSYFLRISLVPVDSMSSRAADDAETRMSHFQASDVVSGCADNVKAVGCVSAVKLTLLDPNQGYLISPPPPPLE